MEGKAAIDEFEFRKYSRRHRHPGFAMLTMWGLHDVYDRPSGHCLRYLYSPLWHSWAAVSQPHQRPRLLRGPRRCTTVPTQRLPL